MDAKGELEFNSISFEKKLSNLKDSQDSINSCCQWCLSNRQYHKKIVSSWLNVLKRVKIEHRLILFYLANDVIQYSKRRNYEFVESWGTTLQKATTLVRDEKIKHKVLRIFKIWKQRGVYSEEFISDLCGLISASPSGKKGEEVQEFQFGYLIQKIRVCTKFETDTDLKLRDLKENNPNVQIEIDSLIGSLKDRAHVDDVEKEVEDYSKQMEYYVNALKLEVKVRAHLISLLSQAEQVLDNDKKDVKTVVSAYKAFAVRVKTLKKKLEEKIPTLSSPPPSPDVNAPSPEPDADIELPISDSNTPSSTTGPSDLLSETAALYTNAGYYNPVPPPVSASSTEPTASFNNQFSTFMGSDLSFDLQNMRNTFQSTSSQNTTADSTSRTKTTNSYNVSDTISSLFPSIAFPPPPPATTSASDADAASYQYGGSSTHIPLQPPPMPPFSKTNEFSGSRYPDTFNGSDATVPPQPQSYTNYEVPPPTVKTSFDTTSNSTTNYPSSSNETYLSNDEYNPEEELETWAPEPTWDTLPPVEMDTPESPPMYEKAGYGDPIEYRDGINMGSVEDVDHRVLPGNSDLTEKTGDVDHRNLININLTGLPNNQDQDYRKMSVPSEPKRNKLDQDYRPPFSMDNFKLLPPPPPPPPKLLSGMKNMGAFNSYPQYNNYSRNSQNPNLHTVPLQESNSYKFKDGNYSKRKNDYKVSPVKNTDIEMDTGHVKVQTDSPIDDSFDLPPPFPDLLDDVNANTFLDNVTEDLEEFDTEDLDGFDKLPVPSSNINISTEYSPHFHTNYKNHPNSNSREVPWTSRPTEDAHPYEYQNYQNSDNPRGNFSNRGMSRGRTNWVYNRGYNNTNNEFRGHLRRGFRGSWGGDRSNWNNRGRGFRGRGGDRGHFPRNDFRGNFRDNF